MGQVANRNHAAVAATGLVAAGAALVAGLIVVGIAVAAVYRAGQALACQALVTVLEGVAALTILLIVVGVFLLAVSALSLLTSPLVLAPFGPVAEAVRFGVRAWLGRG